MIVLAELEPDAAYPATLPEMAESGRRALARFLTDGAARRLNPEPVENPHHHRSHEALGRRAPASTGGNILPVRQRGPALGLPRPRREDSVVRIRSRRVGPRPGTPGYREPRRRRLRPSRGARTTAPHQGG